MNPKDMVETLLAQGKYEEATFQRTLVWDESGSLEKYKTEADWCGLLSLGTEAGGVSSVLSDMVFVQGGTYTRGCTPEQGGDCDYDETPPRVVTLSDLEIGKTEVTNAQFCASLNEMGKNYDKLSASSLWGLKKISIPV